MAREKASINISIWGDADFRKLTASAQSLYFKLMSHPKLDYCGVVEFHPGRLAAMTLEQTPDDVIVAAQELSDNFWCVFDQSTDEVMVRGFLRHDGVLLQPRLVVSATKDYAAIASNKIRAVVVHEIQRFKRERPDLPGWEKPQMMSLLKQESIDVRQTVTELVWGPLAGVTLPRFDHPDDRPNGQADDQGHDHPDGARYGHRLGQTATTSEPRPTTATATSTATATTSDEVAPSKSQRYPQGLGSADPARASSRSARAS